MLAIILQPIIKRIKQKKLNLNEANQEIIKIIDRFKSNQEIPEISWWKKISLALNDFWALSQGAKLKLDMALVAKLTHLTNPHIDYREMDLVLKSMILRGGFLIATNSAIPLAFLLELRHLYSRIIFNWDLMISGVIIVVLLGLINTIFEAQNMKNDKATANAEGYFLHAVGINPWLASGSVNLWWTIARVGGIFALYKVNQSVGLSMALIQVGICLLQASLGLFGQKSYLPRDQQSDSLKTCGI